jgi:hypothetical protein
MNRLNLDRRTQVSGALVEGNSIRSTERMTGIHRDERFLQEAGQHVRRVALHFAHYNFVRQHKSLRITPAMAAGVEERLWSLEELVERTTN